MLDELKILIVSANAARREHLQGFLEPKVSYVLTARDGDEALRYFDQTYFDLVFTELLMPGMGGLELSEHLRERFPEVFVVLCADAKTEVSKRKTGHGGFDYILKGSDRDELFALTKRIAEQKHLVDKSFYPHEDRRKNYRFENIIGKIGRASCRERV